MTTWKKRTSSHSILLVIGKSEGDAVQLGTEKSQYQKISPRAHLILRKRLLLYEQALETSEWRL